MAVTLAASGDNKFDVYGATPVAMFAVTLDSSYPAGGYSLTGAQFGLSRPIVGINIIGVNTAGLVNQYWWNTQTQKLQVLRATAGVAGTAPFQDATAAADFSAVTLTLEVLAQR